MLVNPALNVLAPKTPTVGHLKGWDLSFGGEPIDRPLMNFEEFRHFFKRDYVTCHPLSPVSKEYNGGQYRAALLNVKLTATQVVSNRCH